MRDTPAFTHSTWVFVEWKNLLFKKCKNMTITNENKQLKTYRHDGCRDTDRASESNFSLSRASIFSGRQTKLGTMGKAQCEMRGDVKLRRISTRHSIEPTTYRGNPTNETGNDSEKIARFYTPTRGAQICWWFSISHDFHSSFADIVDRSLMEASHDNL